MPEFLVLLRRFNLSEMNQIIFITKITKKTYRRMLFLCFLESGDCYINIIVALNLILEPLYYSYIIIWSYVRQLRKHNDSFGGTCCLFFNTFYHSSSSYICVNSQILLYFRISQVLIMIVLYQILFTYFLLFSYIN